MKKQLFRVISAVMVFLLAATVHPIFASGTESGNKPPDNLLDGLELVRELRKGNYILYFRHGITDHSTFDTDRDDLASCTTQRLLSPEGRRQMRQVGDAIRALAIPIGRVETSPYCRSIDTATLAFGSAQVEPMLKHTVTATRKESEEQASALRTRLSLRPQTPGTNDVLSSHTANLQEAMGIWPSPEGVAIVFKPDGKDGVRFIATVEPEQWMELARQFQSSK